VPTPLIVAGVAVLAVVAFALSQSGGDDDDTGVISADQRDDDRGRDCTGSTKVIVPPEGIGEFRLTTNEAPEFSRCWMANASYSNGSQAMIYTAMRYETAAGARNKAGEADDEYRRIFQPGVDVRTTTLGDVAFTCGTGTPVDGNRAQTQCSWARGDVLYILAGPGIGADAMIPLGQQAMSATVGF
jgi:hypothetical protein